LRADTPEKQVSNSKDLFASSLLLSASAGRSLLDSCDIAWSLWLDASRRFQDSYYFASSMLRNSSDCFTVACEQGSNKFKLFWLRMPLLLLQEEATAVADPNKPLTMLPALRSASLEAITMLTIGSIAFYCIVFGLWQILFGRVGGDPLKVYVVEEAASVPADHDVVADDYFSEDGDDVVAGQGDEQAEAPVTTATIAAPLRRSKRVAAQLSRVSCSEISEDVAREVAFSMCATSGPRRSARLAAKLRVNGKPHPACR
jgi:hypothetical protein